MTEGEFLEAEVNRELAARGLGSARVAPMAARTHGWLEFRRKRLGTQIAIDAIGVHLEFASPIEGPLLLGALSHFGLGLFGPYDGR